MAEGARSDGRLPLTILGGFLGAGKSTWLRHQLHQGRFRDHAILVNEAAETPVDNLLLAGALRLGVLAGGCACCTGQAALVAALRALCNDASGAEAGRIGGVLLETSGLADPGRIAAAIAADPVLSRRLALRETLVLVDGLHGARQLATEALARAQIEAADALILTKPADAADLARLALTLRLLNPGAALSAAELGPEAVRLRAEAWRGLRVAEVLASPVDQAVDRCWPWGDPQIGPQLRTEWTDAVAQALTQPGLTMAVAPLRRLAEPGGVLDALEAQGLEVDGPEWQAAPSGG